jgi:hypothetical protein
MTEGTTLSKPIPRHHLRGIVSVRRGEILGHGHPYAMLTYFSDGTAEITITPRVKDAKAVELAFRHEIGHWVWMQYVPEDFKKDYGSEERLLRRTARSSDVVQKEALKTSKNCGRLMPKKSGGTLR